MKLWIISIKEKTEILNGIYGKRFCCLSGNSRYALVKIGDGRYNKGMKKDIDNKMEEGSSI